MNIVIISGKIGSGKSSLLRNQKFLKKFHYPQKMISTDFLAKELYLSKNSQYLLQKNPYLRKVIRRLEEGGGINKNLLRKYLFYAPEKIRNFCWKSLELILHPQVRNKILKILQNTKRSSRKKGTVFVECAIPKKLNILSWGRCFLVRSSRFSRLSLLKKRGLSPLEISIFLSHQKTENTEKKINQ